MPSGIYKRTDEHKKTFFKKGHSTWNKGTIGVVKSWNKGIKGLTHSNKTSFKKGQKPWNTGKHHSEETIKKLKERWIGRKHILTEKGKKSFHEKMSKENNPKWNGGVNLRDKHTLFSPEYKEWREKVFKRDNFKCKISNQDCKGQLQAHHILNWKDYPELRFNVNNGIALCHAHHPRGRAKEKRLSPYFMELVSVSK